MICNDKDESKISALCQDKITLYEDGLAEWIKDLSKEEWERINRFKQ